MCKITVPVRMHLRAIMCSSMQKIFACVRVYVCVCLYVCMYMRVRACDSATVHPCMCVHEYVCIDRGMHALYAYGDIPMYVCIQGM